MKENFNFLLSVCEEEIVLSRGNQMWFFSYEDLDSMVNVNVFLDAVGCGWMLNIERSNVIEKCFICQRNEDVKTGVFVNDKYFCIECLPSSVDSLKSLL